MTDRAKDLADALGPEVSPESASNFLRALASLLQTFTGLDVSKTSSAEDTQTSSTQSSANPNSENPSPIIKKESDQHQADAVQERGSTKPSVSGPLPVAPIVYRPTEAAIIEWRERLRQMGVGDSVPELVRSEVLDHNGERAIVFAPVSIRRGQKNSSKEAIEWLTYMEQNHIHMPIWHEENGHEVILDIGGEDRHVDGYCPLNMTAYEYMGETSHRDPLLYDFNAEFRGLGGENKTAFTNGMVYDRDRIKHMRMEIIGFRVISVSGYQWKQHKRVLSVPKHRIRRNGLQVPQEEPQVPPLCDPLQRRKTAPASFASFSMVNPLPSASPMSPSSAADQLGPASTQSPPTIVHPPIIQSSVGSNSGVQLPTWAAAEVNGVTEPVLALLKSIQRNERLFGDLTNMAEKRRQLLSCSKVSIDDVLIGNNFFRFYGIRSCPMLQLARRHFTGKLKMLQYLALRASTHAPTIKESLDEILAISSREEIIPAAFYPNRQSISRQEFSDVIGFTICIIFLLYPAILSQKYWLFDPLSKEYLQSQAFPRIQRIGVGNGHFKRLAA
jgi:hypothetical protein